MKKYIELMEPNRQKICRGILNDFNANIFLIPGSKTKHQVWLGGYADHVKDVMNIACIMYDGLSKKRPLDFKLSDALFVLFLHDFDKLLRYDVKDGKFLFKEIYNKDHLDELITYLASHDYTLSEEELNGVKYVHGEGDDFDREKRIMNSLAAFAHCCDTISARIWYDKE